MRALSLLSCLLAGCASLHGAHRVDMDAVVIAAKAPADLPTEIYDADTVFHYAREAERAGDFAKSKRLYERLLREFPESKLRRAAAFGVSRGAQAQGGCPLALPLYSALRQEDAASGDVSPWIDAHFREAACLVGLQRPKEAAEILSGLLEYGALEHDDKLEAMVSRGIAFVNLGELDLAERDFVLVFAYERERQEREPNPLVRFTVAKAGYHLGEVHRLRFEHVRLEYPDAVLEQRLEEKSQLLLRAQTYYLRAIRLGDLEVAAASGFRVGAMYEHFHGEMVALLPPTDLSSEQVELYRQELRSKIGVLLRKAVKIYEEAVAMAQRTGLRSEWIDKMTRAVERIKKLFLVDLSG